MIHQHLLDIRRGHVDAAGLDQFLEAALERQHALVVQDADITGMKPPLGINRLLGAFGVVVITRRGMAPQQDFSGGARRHEQAGLRVDDFHFDPG